MLRHRYLIGLLGLVIAFGLHGHRGKAQTPPPVTLTFSPVADTWVDDSTPTTNYNTDVVLKADSSPVRISYFRFVVSGVAGATVQQARLRLACGGLSGAPSVNGGTIHAVADNTWDEATLTFATRPAMGPGFQTLGAVALGEVVDLNVLPVVTGDGTYSFALDSTDPDGVSYNSMAAASGQKPQLILTVAGGTNPVVAIAQPLNGAHFFIGDTATLQGTAVDPQQGDLSATLHWTSSLQGALGTGASITASLVQGTHTITASTTDQDSHPGSAQVSVIVTPPPAPNTAPLVAITAPADGGTIAGGGPPVTFTGSANDIEDGSLTAQLVWTSSLDGALGTGGTFTHTLSVGTHTITAKATDSGGLMGSTTATVTIAAPVTLMFTPTADAYVNAGSVSANTGTAKFLRVDSSTRCDSYLRFAVAGIGSRNVTKAILRMQVDSASGANSASGGSLRSLTNNTWGEATITYNNKPAIDGPVLATAGKVALSAVVDFDVTAAVTADGSYNFGFTSANSDNVDYRSRESATPPKLILTLSGNAPVVTVTGPPNQSVVVVGTPAVFTGTASDVEDGTLSSQIHWSSSLDGALGTGASVSSSALRVGVHTITAAVTDSAGMAGQGQITLRVRDPNVAPVVTISAPAAGTTITAGTPLSLAGTATDDFDGNISTQIHWSSSLAGALGTGAGLNVTLAKGTHVLTAAATDSDGASGSAEVTVVVNPGPPAVVITAPLANAQVFAGRSVTFTGTATDLTDGNIAAALEWSSDKDGPIGTGATFSITTLSVGTHVISASAKNSSNLTGTAQHTLIVRPPNQPPVVTIQSPTDGDGLLTANPVLLAATATDTENGNIGASLRWTSSKDGNLGSGPSVTVASLSVGTHTITATATDLDGQAVSATVTVTVAQSSFIFTPIADTYVNSGKPTTNFGTATSLFADSSPVIQSLLRFNLAGLAPFSVKLATLRLTATSASAASSTKGGVVNKITNNTWSEAATTYNNRPTIDGPVLATMTAKVALKQVVNFDVTSGVVTDGVLNFAVTSTVSDDVIYNSREATTGKPQLIVTLKQNLKPVLNITGPASGTHVNLGEAVTFTATATDAESGNLAAAIQWSSSIDGALGTGGSLTKTTLSPGTHTITAKVTDPGGQSAQGQITISVNHPPAVTISAPANNAIVFLAQLPLALAATATDVEDGTLSSQIQWTSSLDGPLGTGPSLSKTLTLGTHVLTAAVTDSTNTPGQAQVTIRVRGPNVKPTLTISAPANNTSVPAGTQIAFTATATDDFDGDLTSQIRWTAIPGGDLGTGGTRTTALGEGSHVVAATVTDSDGAAVSKQVNVTVTPTPPVVTISSPASDGLFFTPMSVTFTATAIDATDGDLGANLTWTSSIDGVIGHGATFSTTTMSVGTHTVTASVTDAGSLSGSATVPVVIKPHTTFPTVTILSPADNGAIRTGKPVLLKGMASDAEDGNLSGSIKWTSSIDGALGQGVQINTSSLSNGTHVLTASVKDLAGAPASASVTFTVFPGTMTLSPVADTYVDAGSPTTAFGTGPVLAADGSPVQQSFLRFTIPTLGPVGITSAVLRLTAGSVAAASSTSGGELHTMTNNTWSEATTTYATRPTIDGPTIATRGAVLANDVVNFTVTSFLVGTGTYNFGLLSTATDDVVYNSREAASGGPQLILTLRGPDEPVVAIASPGDGSTVGAGVNITFSATATDVPDGNIAAGIQWSSNVAGFLGTGPSIVKTLTAGTHIITATVTDANANVGTASITVTAQSGVLPTGVISGFKDFSYPIAVGNSGSNEATAQKPEAHLWYLDGTWWGVLFSTAGNAQRIHKLDRGTHTWSDTGITVDTRPKSRQDCYWNGTKLYMASRAGYGDTGSPNKLLRWTYNSSTKIYTMDAGFPVDLPGAGTESMTLAEDSTHTFWVAYTMGNKVMVAHSTTDDMHWSAPYVIPGVANTSVDADDIAGVIAMPAAAGQAAKIGVFWSHQVSPYGDYFAYHVDGAPDTQWTGETAMSGSQLSDDHFNMKYSADGRLFVGAKTSLTGSNETLEGLLVRSPNGTWSQLYHGWNFAEWTTRTYVVLDEAARKVYLFGSIGHNYIVYKVSDMDSISFPSGPGVSFIQSSKVNDINDPTGTKQNLQPGMGIVVVAASPGDLSYWHGELNP